MSYVTCTHSTHCSHCFDRKNTRVEYVLGKTVGNIISTKRKCIFDNCTRCYEFHFIKNLILIKNREMYAYHFFIINHLSSIVFTKYMNLVYFRFKFDVYIRHIYSMYCRCEFDILSDEYDFQIAKCT